MQSTPHRAVHRSQSDRASRAFCCLRPRQAASFVLSAVLLLFMDCFYNCVVLLHLLNHELRVLAAGTVMPSSKHYLKELGKKLSNYHDPKTAHTVNRHVGYRLAQLTLLVVDFTSSLRAPCLFHTILHKCSSPGYFPSCCRYMEAVDKNDQIAGYLQTPFPCQPPYGHL